MRERIRSLLAWVFLRVARYAFGFNAVSIYNPERAGDHVLAIFFATDADELRNAVEDAYEAARWDETAAEDLHRQHQANELHDYRDAQAREAQERDDDD